MKEYKYFEKVLKNAYFSEEKCQFCGANENCLEGIYFEDEDSVSVCLDCLDKGLATVDIPPYIQNRVTENREEKVNCLAHTPPVPWIQNNDWQACCDDFMTFIGEWKQEDFNKISKDGNGLEELKKLLSPDLQEIVESYDALWEDLNYETSAFAFKCKKCGRIAVVCQEY